MWDDNGARVPMNEFDVAQQEEALRRAGSKPRLEEVEDQRKRGRGQRVKEVTFFVGETLTLKGRRFRVSHIVGDNAVLLEPIGDMVLREGIGGRSKVNMVGRRRKASRN
jgi:hypothetical protein